jgi:hypothetical protein
MLPKTGAKIPAQIESCTIKNNHVIKTKITHHFFTLTKRKKGSEG